MNTHHPCPNYKPSVLDNIFGLAEPVCTCEDCSAARYYTHVRVGDRVRDRITLYEGVVVAIYGKPEAPYRIIVEYPNIINPAWANIEARYGAGPGFNRLQQLPSKREKR